jgi:hypothetical protein
MTELAVARSFLRKAMAASDMRQTERDRAWSLGAVLAESEVDDSVCLLIVRPDVSLGAALALGRRVLGLRLAGYTTIVIELAAGRQVAPALVAVLLNTSRKIERRDGRLVIATEDPAVRLSLARAGLEVSEL